MKREGVVGQNREALVLARSLAHRHAWRYLGLLLVSGLAHFGWWIKKGLLSLIIDERTHA
jgi:hypothetical protein